MKKFLTILLIITLAFSAFSVLQVYAEEEEEQETTSTVQVVPLPEGDSTFESGKTNWAYLKGGKVEIVNNPSGSGKVLAYKDCPDSSFASPIFNLKPVITGFTQIPGTVNVSIDIYTTTDLSCIARMRAEKGGFSACGESGYNNLGNVKTTANTWTTLNYSFEVTKSDLTGGSSYWNFCFDGINKAACGSVVYLDNFSVTYEQSETYDLPTSEEVQEGNLLKANNSTFESEIKHQWSAFSAGKVSIAKNPLGEGRVLRYSECPDPADTENNNTWATPMLDIRPMIDATESTTIYVAMDVYTTGTSGSVPLMIRTSKAEDLGICGEKTYANIGSVGFMTGKWKRIQAQFEVTEEDLANKNSAWRLCFNNTHKIAGGGIIYIDNVYIGYEKEDETNVITNSTKNPDLPIPEKTPIERGEKTLVGTIRWDAFTQSTPDGTNPSSQVAKVLSPKKYHYQAPFFANVEADDTISFPRYTKETWEAEAEYARDGGIDYFAYIWYDTTSDMSQPRKYHLQSKKKNYVKMTGALETIRDEATMNELFEAMKDTCYLKLSERPVLFLYDFDNWTAEEVHEVRQMAANAGVEKALYIVGMSGIVSKVPQNVNKDADALSWYGVAAKKKAEPYADLAKRCEELVEDIGSMTEAFNFDLIPSFTTGRDSLARIETGVSWVDGDPNATADKDKPYGGKYAIQPTVDELEAHIRNVYNYVQNNPNSTTPNMILSYGWNEHEEGGWFCPTLLCDENGDLILDKDGNKQANVERLKTLNKVLVDLRGDEPKFGNTPKAEATPPIAATPTPNGQKGSEPFKAWWIIAAAAVVVCGGVVAIVLIKKKKANSKTEE